MVSVPPVTRSLHVRFRPSSLDTYLLNHSMFDMGSAILRRCTSTWPVRPTPAKQIDAVERKLLTNTIS